MVWQIADGCSSPNRGATNEFANDPNRRAAGAHRPRLRATTKAGCSRPSGKADDRKGGPREPATEGRGANEPLKLFDSSGLSQDDIYTLNRRVEWRRE